MAANLANSSLPPQKKIIQSIKVLYISDLNLCKRVQAILADIKSPSQQVTCRSVFAQNKSEEILIGIQVIIDFRLTPTFPLVGDGTNFPAARLFFFFFFATKPEILRYRRISALTRFFHI